MSELPPSWAEAELSEISEVILGQSPPGTSYNADGEGMPFLQGKTEFGDLRPSFRKWTTDPRKIARPDDVLLSVRAPVGPTNLAPIECCIGRGLAALRPLGGIGSMYVLYGMRATERTLAAEATGTTFEAVTGAQVRAHRLPVAPLNEQRRIVAAIEEHLSRLDAADASLDAASRRVNVLRDTVSRAVLGDFPTVPLVEVAAVASGQTPKGLETLLAGPIPYYKVGDMNAADGRRMGPARAYVTEAGASAARLRIYPAGAVVFPKRGGAIATNKKRILTVPAAVDLNTMAVVPGERLLAEFLLAYLETVDLGSLADGSNVPQINHGDITPLKVPLPPLEEQRRIVAEVEARLSALDALRASIERAQRRSAALRAAVLAKAFRGELVPQDPSDEPAEALLARIRTERSAGEAARLRRRARR